MSSNVNRIELLLGDLPTRNVILYPSRALVCREIEAELKPGANEIEIYGITPTADESSIKLDGFGAAVVTDMTVALVNNKASFFEAYPEDDEVEASDSDDDQSDDSTKDDNVKTLKADLEASEEKLAQAQVEVVVRETRLQYLNTYFATAQTTESEVTKLAKALEDYQRDYTVLENELRACTKQEKDLVDQTKRKAAALKKATKSSRLEKAKAAAAAAKAKAAIERQKAASRAERQRVLAEHKKFWPRKVYKVVIQLEVGIDTPLSSRPTSVGSVTYVKGAPDPVKDVVSQSTSRLALSYITSSASWSPRYDIDFSTSTGTGKITYRAEYINHTSETWTDATVSLSTSQTAFAGLNDEVPWMQPWKISLQKHGNPNSGLSSVQELVMPPKSRFQHASVPDRSELFGVDFGTHWPPARHVQRYVVSNARGLDHLRNARRIAPTAPIASSPFGQPQSRAGASSLFASSMPAPHAPRAAPAGFPGSGLFGGSTGGAFGSVAPQAQALPPPPPAAAAPHPPDQDEEENAIEEPSADYSLDLPVENDWEDHGLTTTYEIPSTRTIAPSSLTRRHKITSMAFGNLVMTSIAVPKLRAAAFLRARFRNPSSSITLLKGAAGLTLDGTFLGNTTLPRISPGEQITLPLGVDPAVHISYAKPSVKRSTQGFINKEASQVFTRSIIITNTKNSPIELLVLDQIPISEDEKLRVEVLSPKGLSAGNDGSVSAGVNANEGKEKGKAWGKARASLKKNGEISWNLNLERAAGVRLDLEYEAKAPWTETIVSK